MSWFVEIRPCSKKISDFGAHNQRSRITIRAEVAGGHGSIAAQHR